jgi:hypothetical protein
LDFGSHWYLMLLSTASVPFSSGTYSVMLLP